MGVFGRVCVYACACVACVSVFACVVCVWVRRVVCVCMCACVYNCANLFLLHVYVSMWSFCLYVSLHVYMYVCVSTFR